MTSLLSPPRKTVGFETPALPSAIASSESDSDTHDDPLHDVLKKARQLTTRHRFQMAVGDAVQLARLNAVAQKEYEKDKQLLRQKRLTLFRSASKKKILPTAKMAGIVFNLLDKPIVKFRRMARAVLLLIQVCHVCKEILAEKIRKEPWFALVDNLVARTTRVKQRKTPRAFVTFVPNERRQLVQLSFDAAEFKRDRRSESVMTDAVRDMMSILPGFRSPQQLSVIITTLKKLFPSFAHYRLSTQKRIGQCAFCDKYKANRVIVKKGHEPDGIYFILTGCLVEKHEGGKQPRLLNAGERFGEGDLLCGNKRRHTVLTKVDSEIFFLHKQDYRDIFALVDDRNNPKNLEICKQHIVFQHFPIQKLEDNPGTWSVNSYKYGELIARDLYDLDWIYVIKSGEARILKYLQPDNIDIKARRRKVQAQINNQSPFYRKKRILNFVEERDYIQSSYRPSSYKPTSRAHLRSAPSSSSSRSSPSPPLPRGCVSLPTTRQGSRQSFSRKSLSAPTRKTLPCFVLDSDVTQGQGQHERKRTDSKTKYSDMTNKEDVIVQETIEKLPENINVHSPRASYSAENVVTTRENVEISHENRTYSDSEDKTEDENRKSDKEHESDPSKLDPERAAGPKRMMERRLSADVQGCLFEKPVTPGYTGRRRSIFFPPEDPAPPPPDPDTTGARRARSASSTKMPEFRGQVIQVGQHTLPAFVQVDTMHPGQIFGLRACLDPEERGPSVSLVSGECEVLQINKKFFMRHCDDAVYSLIRLKNKPYPSEEDLIDRLDVNMQWEEFKQRTLQSCLQQQCRSAR